MISDKKVREPKQNRSILMKEKILDAAMRLICEKGFFETTTNEIAKEARISIGSLYSYFADKDSILMELLERHHKHFSVVFESLETEENRALFERDRREWLKWLVCILVELHTSTREFGRELNALYYVKPEVAAIMDARNKKIRESVLDNMKEKQAGMKLDDLQAASVVVTDMVSALVDRIVFKQISSNKENILQTGVEMIYRGCMEGTKR